MPIRQLPLRRPTPEWVLLARGQALANRHRCNPPGKRHQSLANRHRCIRQGKHKMCLCRCRGKMNPLWSPGCNHQGKRHMCLCRRLLTYRVVALATHQGKPVRLWSWSRFTRRRACHNHPDSFRHPMQQMSWTHAHQTVEVTTQPAILCSAAAYAIPSLLAQAATSAECAEGHEDGERKSIFNF